MKFFIDSANIEEIKEVESLGLLDGVTTNPSLVAKEGGQKGLSHETRSEENAERKKFREKGTMQKC